MILCNEGGPEYGLGMAALGGSLATSGALGYHMTASIGGADMPVVITVLNSYSGWALCAEGFMLDMPLLTTVGALIGCSGAALTKIMCDAMNRDILSVILGGYGTKNTSTGEAMKFEGESTTTSVESVVSLLAESESIIIVPGYGLAVAKGQYPLKDMVDTLLAAGKKVRFGIHPVAGKNIRILFFHVEHFVSNHFDPNLLVYVFFVQNRKDARSTECAVG